MLRSRRRIVSPSLFFHLRRRCSSTLRIGDTEIQIFQDGKSPELVPKGFLKPDDELSNEMLHHLRWIHRKIELEQDLFLIGPPGPEKRHLAMAYCEMTNREMEVVTLTRDTTESDLKQRREIVSGSGIFVNQAPVRAALEGRILVIDGIEAAERNVLPTLNNLLENREMQLEDGRFLVNPRTFDEMRKNMSLEDMESRGLLRVSPDFRVITIGLPVPPYSGYTLDPPLRSRFQGHVVEPENIEELYESMVRHVSSLNNGNESILQPITNLITTYRTLNSTSSSTMFPPFPESTLKNLLSMTSTLPHIDVKTVLKRYFPLHLASDKSLKERSESVAKKFFEHDEKNTSSFTLKPEKNKLTLSFENGVTTSVPVQNVEIVNNNNINNNLERERTVPTPSFSEALHAISLDHAFGRHICVYGNQGCGKSLLSRCFARDLGYQTKLFSLYKDMATRDLFETRRTNPVTGDTEWIPSILVQGAMEGHCVVLDGLHRLPPDNIAALSRLLLDGCVDLPSGRRVFAKDTFRVIALAEPPSSKNQWLRSDLYSLFSFTELDTVSSKSQDEIVQILNTLHQNLPVEWSENVSRLSERLENSQNLPKLTLRQMLRLARSASLCHKEEYDFRAEIHEALLTKFAPSETRNELETILDSVVGVSSCDNVTIASTEIKNAIKIENGVLTVLNTSYPIFKPKHPHLIPNPVFFHNDMQNRVMERMLSFLNSGEKHFLLIGNQGTGKNKIADRLLQLLKKEREYIQLHRDSTLQSLTLSPSLENGQIVWKDSPLVKAVTHGRTLIVDEADKAPLEVICVLKALCEDGELQLADGRRLVCPKRFDVTESNNTVPISENFNMFVLANRPGYPFHGNNLYSVCGDVFAPVAVDNPDRTSELELCSKYGPSVDSKILANLVDSFAELREMVEEGKLTYPFSTRELVSVVTHLEKYPDDGVVTVLDNVFAFDAYDSTLRDVISEVFRSNDIPMPKTRRNIARYSVNLASEKDLDQITSRLEIDREALDVSCVVQRQSMDAEHVWPARCIESETFRVEDMRIETFTEEIANWKLPEHHNTESKKSLAVLNDDSIHVFTSSPLLLESYLGVKDAKNRSHRTWDLRKFGSRFSSSFKPQIASLNDRVALLTKSSTLVIFDPRRDSSRNQWVSVSLCDDLFDDDKKSSSKSEEMFGGLFSGISGRDDAEEDLKMYDTLSNENILVIGNLKKGSFSCLDFKTNEQHTIQVKKPIKTCSLLSQYTWIVQDEDLNSYFLLWGTRKQSAVLRPIKTESNVLFEGLGSYSDQNNNTPAILTSNDCVYAELENIPRWKPRSESIDPSMLTRFVTTYSDSTSISKELSTLNESFVVVNEVPNILRAAHTKKRKYRDIKNDVMNVEDIKTTSQNDVITIDRSGLLRMYQICGDAIETSLKSWRDMFGVRAKSSSAETLKLTRSSDFLTSKPRTSTSMPKHGKIDDKDHVGGNTWAGGTGGSDTAGLGGRGGPYRLDKGFPVHQVSEEAKREVSEEARAAARKMAEEAFQKRLEEIEMTTEESEMYRGIRDKIGREVEQLRGILKNAVLKSKERGWKRNETTGELDDSKIVDGLAGERAIFRRRVDKSDDDGIKSKRPRRLKILLDNSGSMYRFNGMDGRLNRVLELAGLILESFEGFEEKFVYNLTGHSGDSPEHHLVDFDSPPRNELERLRVIERMVAHSQYCMSGDHTVEALELAIDREQELQSQRDDGDEKSIVIMVSDANMKRYGIHPRELASQMTRSQDVVSTYAIFIASLGDEALQLSRELPAGRGFVCMNTEDLPVLFQRIFSSEFGGGGSVVS